MSKRGEYADFKVDWNDAIRTVAVVSKVRTFSQNRVILADPF